MFPSLAGFYPGILHSYFQHVCTSSVPRGQKGLVFELVGYETPRSPSCSVYLHGHSEGSQRHDAWSPKNDVADIYVYHV